MKAGRMQSHTGVQVSLLYRSLGGTNLSLKQTLDQKIITLNFLCQGINSEWLEQNNI